MTTGFDTWRDIAPSGLSTGFGIETFRSRTRMVSAVQEPGVGWRVRLYALPGLNLLQETTIPYANVSNSYNTRIDYRLPKVDDTRFILTDWSNDIYGWVVDISGDNIVYGTRQHIASDAGFYAGNRPYWAVGGVMDGWVMASAHSFTTTFPGTEGHTVHAIRVDGLNMTHTDKILLGKFDAKQRYVQLLRWNGSALVSYDYVDGGTDIVSAYRFAIDPDTETISLAQNANLDSNSFGTQDDTKFLMFSEADETNRFIMAWHESRTSVSEYKFNTGTPFGDDFAVDPQSNAIFRVTTKNTGGDHLPSIVWSDAAAIIYCTERTDGLYRLDVNFNNKDVISDTKISDTYFEPRLFGYDDNRAIATRVDNGTPQMAFLNKQPKDLQFIDGDTTVQQRVWLYEPVS